MVIEAPIPNDSYPPSVHLNTIISDIQKRHNIAILDHNRDFLNEQLDVAVEEGDISRVYPIMAIFRSHGNIDDGTSINRFTEKGTEEIKIFAKKTVAEIMEREGFYKADAK